MVRRVFLLSPILGRQARVIVNRWEACCAWYTEVLLYTWEATDNNSRSNPSSRACYGKNIGLSPTLVPREQAESKLGDFQRPPSRRAAACRASNECPAAC